MFKGYIYKCTCVISGKYSGKIDSVKIVWKYI